MGTLLLVFSLVFAQQTEQTGGVTVTRIAKPRKELQFTVTVPASLDDAWAAFSTTEGLKTWLWSDARVDLRPNGDWLVLYPGGKTGGGTIVSFKSKKQLTVRALAPETFPTVRKERTTAAKRERDSAKHQEKARRGGCCAELLQQSGFGTTPPAR